jgi:S-adenosylmethionine hydrolase
MARSNNSFIKKQKADSKAKRKKEKIEERLERRDQPTSGKLEDMIAYVDEFGNLSDSPPEEPVVKKNKDPKEIKISKP